MNTSRSDHEAALAGEPNESRLTLPPTVADHELLRCIGRGSYGEVWLGRNVLGEYRAVKIVYRRVFEHNRPFEREFEGIKKFEPISRSHPSQLNILHVGRSEEEGYFYYVMELADDANAECGMRSAESAKSSALASCAIPLSERPNPHSYVPRTLKQDLQRRGRLTAEECVQLGLSLSTALAHLHGHGLIHRDVKPSNIVFVNGVPKLADIGLVTDAEATLSFVGTEGFIPPEGPISAQADLYSLGKVLYEASMGRSRLDFPTLPANWDELPAEQQTRLLEFNEVLVKACENNPRKRYQSAQQMQADLAVLRRGESVRRKHSTEQLWNLSKKIALGGTVVALLVLGALRLSTSFGRQEARPSTQLAAKSLTPNLEALNAYSKGRYAYNKNTDADMTNAIRFFEHAVALDPNCADAYAGLASCYTWLDAPRNWHRVREPAEKALALNPNLPEAHKCLAFVKYMLDWRWTEAKEEFRLATRLDPQDGETLRAYGHYLKNMGRTKEAIEVLRRAHELDPRALSTTEMLGTAFFDAGDYAQALRQYQTCLDLEPTHPGTRSYMARVYEEQGLFLKAIDMDQEDSVLSGENPKDVAQRYAGLRKAYQEGGTNGYWRKNLEIDRADPTISDCELAYDFARIGDRQSVFEYLELAFQKHEVQLVRELKTNRAFDRYRREPEFIALLKKMKWE